VDAVRPLSAQERLALNEVTERYSFRANSYYLGLINWSDPDDPIRKIIVPQYDELREFGDLDASNEEANYVAPGCQHKYPHTALLLCTEICGAYCRFCFRKRLFMELNDEATVDVMPAIDYIKRTPQITNVLLTGGDPLFLSTRRLESIISRLRRIPHVKIIRIGTKMPAFNPYRIIDDPHLLQVLSRYSTPDNRIYVITHFNVPQELTEVALYALDLLMKAGVILANQSPLLRSINDNPRRLAELMRRLSFAGVPPYYFFQCRPTEGNWPFSLPLVDSYRVLEKAKTMVSGLAKRARLVMSHDSGKIEMVGLTSRYIYMRYHRARNPRDEGRFLTFYRDDRAHWLDKMQPVRQSPPNENRYVADDWHPLGLD
jgi:KamA family protein